MVLKSDSLRWLESDWQSEDLHVFDGSAYDAAIAGTPRYCKLLAVRFAWKHGLVSFLCTWFLLHCRLSLASIGIPCAFNPWMYNVNQSSMATQSLSASSHSGRAILCFEWSCTHACMIRALKDERQMVGQRHVSHPLGLAPGDHDRFNYHYGRFGRLNPFTIRFKGWKTVIWKAFYLVVMWSLLKMEAAGSRSYGQKSCPAPKVSSHEKGLNSIVMGQIDRARRQCTK